MASFGMPHKLKTLLGCIRDEEGQALVEYALLISLIAVVCLAAVGTFGLKVADLFSQIVSVYP
jgi:Flp pilus assembly pilin Flp